MRALVRPRPRPGSRATVPDDFGALRDMPAAERDRRLLEMVRGYVAGVLGHARPELVDVERGLLDLGFDSLTAVDLRNRLSAATGLRLSTTLVFDHPTTTALAEHLGTHLVPDPADDALRRVADLESLLTLAEDTVRDAVLARLRPLLRVGGSAQEPGDDVDLATDDELFAVLDQELGTS